ncbi:MAG: YkgJ family cysteine cluster protein [Methanobacteriota archaeon]
MPKYCKFISGSGWVTFECSQCGSCCHHLGQVYSIKEIRGGYDFLVCNQYTGDLHEIKVDDDKIVLFEDKRIFSSLPQACPFFRYSCGKAYCTVHYTRPGICREYACWRLLIIDHKNNPVGKIKFSRTFCSDNETLRHIWDRSIEEMSGYNDKDWEIEMIRRLSRAGYSIHR